MTRRTLLAVSLLAVGCGGTPVIEDVEPVVEETPLELPDEPELDVPVVDEAAAEEATLTWTDGPFPPAVVHWEIMSPDAATLAAWYAEVFGWETMNWADEEGAFEYHLLFSRGTEYGIGGGIGQVPPAETEEEAIPPYLSLYVDVQDIDAMAEQVTALGGTVVHGPEDIPDVGRMAMFVDPMGTMMAGMQAAEHDDHEMPTPATNPVVHWEIATTDAAALTAFYGELFDFEFTTHEEHGYHEVACAHPFGIGGGIEQLGPEAGFPPYVTFYVGVDDLQAYLDAATAAGATAVVGPTHIDEGVDIAMFTDPEGHVVGLFLMHDGGHEGEMPAAAEEVVEEAVEAVVEEAVSE